MIIIDGKGHIEEQLKKERKKLEQSLEVYRSAIVNNYTYELPFLLKRVECNQRGFQRIYEKLNPTGFSEINSHH